MHACVCLGLQQQLKVFNCYEDPNDEKSTMHTGGKVGRKAVSDVVQAKRLPHVLMFK